MRAIGRTDYSRRSAKLHIFHTSLVLLEIGIIGYYVSGRRRYAGKQTPVYRVLSCAHLHFLLHLL